LNDKFAENSDYLKYNYVQSFSLSFLFITSSLLFHSPKDPNYAWRYWYESRSIILLFTIREWVYYVQESLKKPKLVIKSTTNVKPTEAKGEVCSLRNSNYQEQRHTLAAGT
jgi:hypothetical protein